MKKFQYITNQGRQNVAIVRLGYRIHDAIYRLPFKGQLKNNFGKMVTGKMVTVTFCAKHPPGRSGKR